MQKADGLTSAASAPAMRDEDQTVSSRMRSALLITAAHDIFKSTPTDIMLFASAGVASAQPGVPGSHRILDALWSDEQGAQVCCEQTEYHANQIVAALCEPLNNRHAVQRSLRYWTLLLTPWLHQYLSVVMERTHAVRRAQAIAPHVQTFGPDPAERFPVADTLDFALRAQHDPFNFAISADIAELCGVAVRRLPLSTGFAQSINQSPSRKRGWVGAGLNWLARAFWRRQAVFATQSYLSISALFKLFCLSRGRFIPIHPPPMPSEKMQLDVNARDELFRGLSLPARTGHDWVSVAIGLLPIYFPWCFLEGFGRLQAFSRHHYPDQPRAILTANALYYDEAFKEWAGRSAERGTVLIGAQHGGNFGIQRYLLGRRFEVGIVDKYLAWGKSGAEIPVAHAVVTPPQLIGTRRRGTTPSTTKLLYSMTLRPRFCAYVHPLFHPNEYARHLDWQIALLSGLQQSVLSDLVLRTHAEDLGWGMREKLSAIAEFKYDTLALPFQECLTTSKLHLTDNLGTTFCESLARNVPTVLCINPDLHPLTDEATRVFGMLGEAEILFHRPVLAAAHLNRIWRDVDSWWQSNRVQNAVGEYCAGYAQVSQSPLKQWWAAVAAPQQTGARSSVGKIE